MSLIHLHAEQNKSAVTPRVSWRTLVLLLELLVAVVAWRYLAVVTPVQADAIWLAGDCHTASSIQVHAVDHVVTTPALVTPEQDPREP